ncbi:DEAD/DEAH box helicase [Sphingobacterium multivorum]|uniref:DEAD/DEAH box helicase n=1 Tax=Sphingobacterium multivorum TaxID=28454 RepID=UPI0028AD45CB|nr:DEAD/DEAH box helicase [Sphingobacterium multivorum]
MMGIGFNYIAKDAKIRSVEKILPKRNSSEPLIIPWEDGFIGRMTPRYLTKYYADDEIPFVERDDIVLQVRPYPPKYELRLKNKSGITVKIELTAEYLSINCSCSADLVGLCEHEAILLSNKLQDSHPNYLKGLYQTEMNNLPVWKKKIVPFKVCDNYSYAELTVEMNNEYGRFYHLAPNDYESGLRLPVRKLEGYLDLKQNDEVYFFVTTNFSAFGLPVFFPFHYKFKRSRSFSYSYLLDESNLKLSLNSYDQYLELFSRRFAALLNEDKILREEKKELVSEDINYFERKQWEIIQVWRDLLENPPFPIKLRFVETFRRYRFAQQINLKNSRVLDVFTLTKAQGNLHFKVEIDDQDQYLKMRVCLYYSNQLIDCPEFLGDENCFFLKVSNGEILFIDNLIQAAVLQKFRQWKYRLTVFKEDFHAFLNDYLIPLSKIAELVMLNRLGENMKIPQVFKPFKKIATISVIGQFLCLEAFVEYDKEGRFSLNSRSNLIVQERQNRLTYFERDKFKEEDFQKFFKTQHSILNQTTLENNWLIPLKEIENTVWLYDFMDSCLLNEIAVEIDHLKQGSAYYPFPLNCTVRNVRMENNHCSILLGPKFGRHTVSMDEFEDLIMGADKVFTVGEGTFGVIRSADREIYRPLFLGGRREEDCFVLNTIQLVSMQKVLDKIDKRIIQDSIRERREKLAALDQIPLLEIPKGLRAQLRPYQQVGFSWLAFLNEFQWGGLLADDMGLGKTLQIITLLEYFYQLHPMGKSTLIVVPNSLLFNWENEYKKFAPHRNIGIYHGKLREGFIFKAEGMVILTTYGTILTDAEYLTSLDFSYLIMDESQAVKNRNSKRFETLSMVKADYRVAMTGTPIENGVEDIYAQMSIVNPGFFGNYGSFNKTYKGIKGEDTTQETTSSLQKMIQPFILRRTKKQVALDLPEKTETILYMDMLPEQRKIYDKARKIFKGEIESNLNSADSTKSKFLAIEALQKLRQLCNSPMLMKDGGFSHDSIKLDFIDEIMDEVAPNHKILLFSAYTSMLKLVAQRIENKGIAYAYLDGKMNQDQRQNAVERFQNENGCRVFLISLKAGGTGLNLTAADYVYILDPWWNPAAEAQAIDRCYRIGQDKHVMAYKIVCRDSVEEYILALQESKKRISEGLILDETNLMKSISKEELLKLFE